MNKFVIILVALFGIIGLTKAKSTSFDWVKISTNSSFSDFNWSDLPEGLTREMVLSLLSNELNSSPDPITILTHKGKILAFFPCRFEVLNWNGSTWENLYKGYSGGFNCVPHFFIYKDKIFSYGRYGVWHAHSELLYFDYESGYWENLSAQNIPINFAGIGVFLIGDKLISIFGQYVHQSSGMDFSEEHGFYFDFNTKTWYPLNVNIESPVTASNWTRRSMDLKDYGVQFHVYEAEIGAFLIRKKDLSFKFLRRDFNRINQYSIAYGVGNEMVFLYEKETPVFFNAEKEWLAQEKIVGGISLKNNYSYIKFMKENWKILSLIFSLIIIILSWLIYKLKNYDQKNHKQGEETLTENQIQADEVDDEIVLITQKLISNSGKTFEIDEFDHLIGIDKVENLEYRRVRRSRLIKMINNYHQQNYGKNLVQREKSDFDKRIVFYKISSE